MTTTQLSSNSKPARLRPDVATLLEPYDSAADDQRIVGLIAQGFFHRSDDAYLQPRELPYVLKQWEDMARWVLDRSEPVQVRAFNPRQATHGYYLDRTVLQTNMADQAFIFDTLHTLLSSRNLPPYRCIHPILRVDRNDAGHVTNVDPLPHGAAEGEAGLESMMHFELPLVPDDQLEALAHKVTERLRRIRLVVQDFQPMRNRALFLAAHLSEFTDGTSNELYRELALVQKFFHWLVDDNFVFIGFGEFERGDEGAVADGETLLGLARPRNGHRAIEFPVGAAAWLNSTQVCYLGKGDSEAAVHRPGKIDHIAVRFTRDGAERIAVFAGLYTHKAISEEIPKIPILREKLDSILEAQAAVTGSQLEHKLEQAFRAVPVEFLFTAPPEAIEGALRLIITAEEAQETGVDVLRSGGDRAAFVLVSIRKERYTDELRQAVTSRLMEVLGANYVDTRLDFGTGGNVVLQYYVTSPKGFRPVDNDHIQAAVAAITDSWHDQLGHLLEARFEGEEAVVRRWRAAFTHDYAQLCDPTVAVEDVAHFEELTGDKKLVVAVGGGTDDLVGGVTLIKLYQAEKIFLTDSTPVLDHFGLRVIDQTSWTVKDGDGCARFVDTFRVVPQEKMVDLGEQAERLVEALEAVLTAEARDDSLNGLILTAGLDYREVGVLRAYIAYARQQGATDPLPNVHRTWRHNPKAAHLLMRLFRSRFKPAIGAVDDPDRQRLVERNESQFLAYLDTVELVASDRILRRAWNHVSATIRTNFYAAARRDGHPLSLKIDCSKVTEMVDPRPYREIFVHHISVEGIHLRGGPVARGGLRWSDRPSDFRTEVLGLMDTQMVKNVLIVPVGAKGGFILKQSYGSWGEARTAADEYYKVFIRGLLDVTDNVVDGHVIPPVDVVRYDGDDPYLVVAADKGTAHLSDTANGIAEEYGFWLGDAFASGGSQGYDHKKYGITAKGAWVCARRHFREVGINPEVDEITAVGIGDMSGDVFGNGLLLSKTVKLLAAFNHMHIFLDPNPEAGASWVERDRLFNLSRSTWDDYDKSLLSEGGCVLPRHAKSVTLTPEAQSMLRLDTPDHSGDAIVKAILKMEADLLWNGGIGTYVKASHETHRQAGDSANDAVRVSAKSLRFKVIGEGGNLGFTQAARVEFAAHGGRINTDAVDNSGGVDMSDHEVNLKILFRDIERAGVVTRDERNAVLLDIAEQVSDDVQFNNHMHSLMLSLDAARSSDELDDFRVLINDLEADGRLDRARHVVPEDGEILRRERNGEGLSRPELAKIGPFVKMRVYEALLSDERFDTPWIERWLLDYFPARVSAEFSEHVLTHQLRTEIAATVITNRLVDSMGMTHFSRLERLTGRDITEIAYASLIAADLMDTWELKSLLRDIDGVRASVEYVKLRHVETAVAQLAMSLLQRDIDVLDAPKVLERFREGFVSYEKSLSRIMDRSEKSEHTKRLRYLRNRNIRVPGVERAAGLELMPEAAEAVRLSETTGLDVLQAGMLLKKVGADSQMLTARQLALPEDANDGWEARAIADLGANMLELCSILAAKAVAEIDSANVTRTFGTKPRGLSAEVSDAWNAYRKSNDAVFKRAKALAKRIKGARARGLAPAMVLYGAVRVLKAGG